MVEKDSDRQKEIDKIKIEVREILDKFSVALGKVKLKEGEEWNVERDNERRIEKDGKICDSDFRKIMFENSTSKDEDSIIGEKKTW